MLIFLLIIGIIAGALIIGRVSLANRLSKEVEWLFSQSGSISDKIYDDTLLASLPEPVQRYFRYVLKNGQPYISYVRLKHTGKFKTGQNKNWIKIRGEQYFTTGKPGFIWKGTTSMFTARDMYIGDAGRLVVSLFSVFNIVDGKGEKFNQAELLRWLGESVWFPTNLLPDDKLLWMPIDNTSAKLIFNYAGVTIFYIVIFNGLGEITEFQTERYMGKENLETWVGKISDYKEINGVKIPIAIEGIWRLAKGDYSYARFKVETIEFDKPEKF